MRKKGFTLVELIVVVIIIGILAIVGIPQYRRALERARGAVAYSTLGNIQEGEKLYYVSADLYLTPGNILPGDNTTKALDIVVPANSGWAFSIAADTTTGFKATAKRGGTGACKDKTIVMDGHGSMTDNWKTCVDSL